MFDTGEMTKNNKIDRFLRFCLENALDGKNRAIQCIFQTKSEKMMDIICILISPVSDIMP